MAGRLVRLTLSAALVTGSTAPSPERRIVEEAAAALGGLARLQAVTTLSIEGSGKVWALGQNRTHESELLKWEVREYRRSIDFANRRWREQSVHTPTFRTGWPDPFRVVGGYDADLAYDLEAPEDARAAAEPTTRVTVDSVAPGILWSTERS